MNTPRLLWSLLLLGAASHAADEQKTAWDVSSPPGERREIAIDVRSGTWMNVAVSPDGQRLAFDLLGDIYELPIAGGEAKALTSGMAWDTQPRYSPDGKRIAFTSDRTGGDNLWIMNADGAAPRQITKESFRLLNSPAWHPNGNYLAGRKHFTTRRSLGTGEIWLYNLNGGDGVQLVKRPNEDYQKELGEPVFSADGRFLYYSQNSTPGNTFQYAQDSNDEVFAIHRVDLASKETDVAVGGAGGAVRPTPSPDGRYIAFVRRLRTATDFKSALYLKDLQSGDEMAIYPDLDRDMQETWAITGLYPTMDWTPDSRSIVFWAGGGIKRLELASRTVRDIPFHVTGTRASIAPPRFDVNVAPDQVQAHMVRFAVVSPDQRRVIFESFGHLWLRDISGGAARRLTRDDTSAFELFPSWSRDGKRIVFVRWTDATLGEIHIVDASGGRSRKVTQQPGHYFRPRFSPDGASLVFERNRDGEMTSPLWSENPGIYLVPVAGGEMRRLSDKGHHPHFGAAADRIFYDEDEQPFKETEPGHLLVSVDGNGKDRRVHARSNYARQIEVSMDAQWLAFRENYHVYVVPMPPGGEIDLSLKTNAVPMRRASDVGGDYLNWNGTDSLTWIVGPSLYRASMAELFAAGTTADKHGNKVADLSTTQPADKPHGTVALTGARIVTMNDSDEVIENGVVVVRDNRIVAIGPSATTSVPADAKQLDVSGRTVIPGLIDIHAHGAQGVDDLVPQQNYVALAHLAMGVTTIHDPSNQASEIFAASEYQRTGRILGPRMFSTGEIVYGAHSESFASIESLEDARNHVARLKAQGAISIKNYIQPRREQRQMAVTAAREAGMMIVAEGGALYQFDMTIISDGNTGLEHNLPPQHFYDDVMQFWPATGVNYTPTLIVTFGGLGAEDYFYQDSEVWTHPILSRFVPPHILQPRAVRRPMAPLTDYQPIRDSAANAKRLFEKGVMVNIGAHGQREGLGSHWEMWAFVLGGMTSMQALHTATIDPARYLGFAKDLGSLETGKLADMLVIDGNPLQDIRVTDKIAYVVQNGRIYEGGTLAEKVTGERKVAPLYWQK